MKLSFRNAFLILASATPLLALAQARPAAKPVAKPTVIASFNLAWAGTAADFDRHVAVCSAPGVNWCDSRMDGRASDKAREQARAAQCAAAFEAAAGSAAQALLVAPCNAYKANARDASKANYAEKLAGLRATVGQLIEGERALVIAFQEVRSAAVLQEVLGKHAGEFELCVAPHGSFQTLGFAWAKSLSNKPGVCQTNPALSGPAKRLRPGLELTLNLKGEAVTFMNVHLKSACANLITTRRFEGHLLTDDDSDCQALNRQVAPLEAWIEAVAKRSPKLVILGDFNRRIDEEAAAKVAKTEVRSTGVDPAKPNPVDAKGRVSSRYLWNEISDGSPNLFQLPLDENAQASGCRGFVGLDHMVISQWLRAGQGSELPRTRKIAVQSKPGQAIQTSDHCPMLTELKL